MKYKILLLFITIGAVLQLGAQGRVKLTGRVYDGDNQPEVVIDYRLNPGEGQRYTYRDRRYVLRGYAVCTDFYSPDYSRKPLPEAKDHRRTLLWMPRVKFNDRGEATVRLYNNGKSTTLSVEAEGITAAGRPVVWKTENLSK